MNTFQEWIDDIFQTCQNIIKINKMSAGKDISIENKFVEFEINAMYKTFMEHSELNRRFHYIKTSKEIRDYTLPASLTRILKVNYIQEFKKFELKKLKERSLIKAQAVTGETIGPTLYDDTTVQGIISIYPSPAYDSELIEIYGQFELTDLYSPTDKLLIPVKFQPACRNYLLNRFQVLCGIMHENASGVSLLEALDKKLIAEAISCRRMREFYNPDRDKFVNERGI